MNHACAKYHHPIHALEKMMKMKPKYYLAVIGASTLVIGAGCSDMSTPATSKMAVSSAAVDNAAGAGGGQFAPVEMSLAREKMTRARQAMADKNYPLALDLANQAQVDARLAQGKADAAKAQLADTALQDDIRVLREELTRASK